MKENPTYPELSNSAIAVIRNVSDKSELSQPVPFEPLRQWSMVHANSPADARKKGLKAMPKGARLIGIELKSVQHLAWKIFYSFMTATG